MLALAFYLTNAKGLDNLVWLHGYNGQPQGSFHPGKQYLDIGGADTYAGNGNYDPLKPMTTPCATSSAPPCRSRCTRTARSGPGPDDLQRRALGAVRHVARQPPDRQQLGRPSPEGYNHSYVVTRDELPSLK
ncbi:glycosyl hydrolase [Saccharothrix isguenensis]